MDNGIVGSTDISLGNGMTYVSTSPYRNIGGLNSYKGNLHMHTTNSDGAQTPEEMATEYLGAGFDWINFSDHDVATADPEVDGILCITGVEEVVTTADGTDGHIITANSTASASSDPQTVIDAAPYSHLAHPWEVLYPWSVAATMAITGYYAIEVDDPNDPTLWDELLTLGGNVYGVDVSDSHDVGEYARGWMHVFASSLTVENVITALQNGNFYSSNGNEITIDDDGNRLKITTEDVSNIRFIGKNGDRLQTNNGATTAEYYYQEGDLYVRAVIYRQSDWKIAFTNAVMYEIAPVEPPSKWARTCGVCEAWNRPFLCDLLRSTGQTNCIFGNIN